ncbi:MAG: B3/B4 domain-containing protein [Nitrososphaerales archaeon]
MMISFSEKFRSIFKDLEIVEVVMDGLQVQDTNEELELLKKELALEVKEKYPTQEDLRNNTNARCYRDFFWKVGIDPTKTRPSAEALTRRLFGGRELPRINTLVDAYNVASVRTQISIAAFDLDKIGKQLELRFAKKGERFLGIGMSSPIELEGVEAVIEDKEKKELIAVYPYRDSEASKVSKNSVKVLFLMCGVPGIASESLLQARSLTTEYMQRFCAHSKL